MIPTRNDEHVRLRYIVMGDEIVYESNYGMKLHNHLFLFFFFYHGNKSDIFENDGENNRNYTPSILFNLVTDF